MQNGLGASERTQYRWRRGAQRLRQRAGDPAGGPRLGGEGQRALQGSGSAQSTVKRWFPRVGRSLSRQDSIPPLAGINGCTRPESPVTQPSHSQACQMRTCRPRWPRALLSFQRTSYQGSNTGYWTQRPNERIGARERAL